VREIEHVVLLMMENRSFAATADGA